jgi:hypothetical protein
MPPMAKKKVKRHISDLHNQSQNETAPFQLGFSCTWESFQRLIYHTLLLISSDVKGQLTKPELVVPSQKLTMSNQVNG